MNYSNARYEPFRVNRIVDVGDDAQFGERKVLLDGVTPAWGVWNEAPGGERAFEVHRTQQFPGLDAPAEGPLPGDYRLKLASDDSPDGRPVRQGHLPDGVGRCHRDAGLRRNRIGLLPRTSAEPGNLSPPDGASAGSARALAVVHAVHGAVDRRGVVTGKERDRLGDVDGIHEPAR